MQLQSLLNIFFCLLDRSSEGDTAGDGGNGDRITTILVFFKKDRYLKVFIHASKDNHTGGVSQGLFAENFFRTLPLLGSWKNPKPLAPGRSGKVLVERHKLFTRWMILEGDQGGGELERIRRAERMNRKNPAGLLARCLQVSDDIPAGSDTPKILKNSREVMFHETAVTNLSINSREHLRGGQGPHGNIGILFEKFLAGLRLLLGQ